MTVIAIKVPITESNFDKCFIYSKIHHYEIACYIGVSLLFTSSGIAGPAILVVPIS